MYYVHLLWLQVKLNPMNKMNALHILERSSSYLSRLTCLSRIVTLSSYILMCYMKKTNGVNTFIFLYQQHILYELKYMLEYVQ